MGKIMVFGTFDIIHPGHKNFLLQARKLGQPLIVVIARDRTVMTIKHKIPRHSEIIRKKQMTDCGLAEIVILGNLSDKYAAIKKYRPEVIALGYDQKAFIDMLPTKLTALGLDHTKIIKLKAYKPEIYKTTKMLKGIKPQSKLWNH